MVTTRYRTLICLTGSLIIVMAVLSWTPRATGRSIVKCAGKKATIVGTNRADVIRGTPGPDVIAAKGGKDTVKGRGGNDTICGGGKDNYLSGGGGRDLLVGGPDNDVMVGGPGDDQLLGKAGNDHLSDGSAGVDTLAGGADTDVCTYSVGDTVSCEFDTADSVIFAPFGAPVSPKTVDVESTSDIGAIDIYTVVDRSGSMSSEITAIKNNLATALNALTCPPAGTGDPADCIPDLWAGAGTVGYSDSGVAAFQNWIDIQPNASFASLPTTEPSSTSFLEPLTFSVYATVTGEGGASFGMGSVPARASCTPSPAANAEYATFGYPCFRDGALPVVVLATDEAPISGPQVYTNPTWAVVKPQMLARGARLIGVVGDGATTGTIPNLQQMATDTGAVDATNGYSPLVFTGAGSNAATAISNAIRTFVNGVPLEVRATAVDDPSDGVDAAAAFVKRLEVLPSGTPECTAGLTSVDDDEDGFAETYQGALPGTPLCWKLVARKNTTVAATSTDQVFRTVVEVTVDGISVVDEREVFFVVPAAD